MARARLEGKVALVTGASRGIGRGIALRLARDGCDVVVGYGREKARAEDAVREIRELGRQAISLRGNVADLTQVRRLVAATHEAFGRLDILVNNAGGAIRKPFADITPEDYDEQFGVTRGTFFAMQEAARRMADGGRIVNISSVAARTCPADAAIYAGAKAAMEAFARCLSRELGARGITVNVVAPGATMTDLLQGAPEHVRQSVKRNAFGRAAEVPDIADVVGMLVSEDARWLTGQVIRADGGL